ncbi:MAG TPA: hypothetical protein ENN79_02370 [Desulfobacteraceae bacterium]|nr:hypothetical protein [Desulfobacteraceae bacterium]
MREEDCIDTLLFYFKDDSGGVIPARVSSSAPLVLFAEMQLCGSLVHDRELGPLLIVRNPRNSTDSNRDPANVRSSGLPPDSAPLPETSGNAASEQTVNPIAQFIGGEGRLPAALLSQLGARLLQVLHPTCTHQSTNIQSGDSQTLCFVTRYSGWLKAHTLVWEVTLGGPVLIRDFRFVSDTSSVPSAFLLNQAKDIIVQLLRQHLHR